MRECVILNKFCKYSAKQGDSEMLLEFETKNYKSFIKEAVFSMIAAPKQKGLDYSLLREKIKRRTIKGLCSGLIYGPNASGKTNIIGAMDTFRAIVLRGNIRNSEDKSSPNAAAHALELIPNNKLSVNAPVEFGIQFYENGMLIDYKLIVDLGEFLEENYARKILKEELAVNENMIFSRKGKSLFFGDIDTFVTKQEKTHRDVDSRTLKIAEQSLSDDELFITNGFKLIISKSFAGIFLNWFTEKFMVVYRADSLQTIRRFSDPQKRAIYVEKTTNEAAELFGINSNVIGYVVGEEDTEAKLDSLLKTKDGRMIAISAELFESYGTIRFVNLFPLVLKAIQTGGTLIVDEFDNSIHPMALMNIINIFHNDDININKAQLVFDTHNPIFLNSNLVRRDEIHFVERDDVTQQSEMYTLADFGTSGDKGVRKHEDYMKNYFVSRYGAIKDIDFSSLFENVLKESGV